MYFDVVISYTYEPPETQQYERGVGFHPPLLIIESVKVVGARSYNPDGTIAYSKGKFGEWQKDLESWARREIEDLVDGCDTYLYAELTNE
jgi:hypothetical protein